MSTPHSAGGFSLFPNTSATRPPSRNQQSRPRAQTPQGRPSTSTEPTPPRAGRQPSVRRAPSTREGKQRQSNNPWQHALDNPIDPEQHQGQHHEQHQEQQWPFSQHYHHQQQQQQQQLEHHNPYHQQNQQPPQRPQPPALDTTVGSRPPVEQFTAISLADVPPRCETALSEAKTLVRSPSVSSIAKPPLAYIPSASSSQQQPQHGNSSTAPAPEPAFRSIFPTYNPELPLDRQEYHPTQTSPVHIPQSIPQSAISRPLYSPRGNSADGGPLRSPGMPMQSPGMTPAGQPRRNYEPPVTPPVSTTEELRALWKVTNGWKASSLEGRIFCLKMTTQPDAPVYTLSSASSQPFYNLRVDPTSVSAWVSLSRFDPNKPFKGPKPGSIDARNASTPSPTPRRASSSSKAELKHDAKHWHEVLGTQLEEASRRQPPNDGLVAQLWPTAASRLVADRANDATTVALAEHECARLVWDADSSNHFLVHPALAVPFCVTIERNPAYSRTEYTLEHLESPVHLARLTRDGTGAGWVEVDTSIAAKIDAVYIVDVAIAALILVAHADEQFPTVEVFEPPPVFGGPGGSLSPSKRSSRSSRMSRASRRESKREEKQRQKEIAESHKKKSKKEPKTRLEQFEMDLESQTSDLKKGSGEKEKVPGVARGLIAVLTVIFKCVIWCFTLVFKALTGLVKCLSSDKL
ncbi:hypothetical protein QBC34DRAFT_141090 [Podospora aff. communis PSN243]|uniref:Acetylserotonin methytransferase-like protein n=1 Tax=Podospora aff. communis PSN243 TaxID=3040156 RepID=A0AAV9H2G6_9PEZI|nr:hypothetical protein QBC34DRAFT_141090 [Podospora aff. communis PSN243]